jgi:hypothetical protein
MPGFAFVFFLAQLPGAPKLWRWCSIEHITTKAEKKSV